MISFVTENATVPVVETGAGNCHIFVDESADLDMADRIVINAKTQRPSVCNAAEKLLVHERIAEQYVPHIVKKLLEKGVEVRGDEEAVRIAAGMNVRPAEPKIGRKSICDFALPFGFWPISRRRLSTSIDIPRKTRRPS